MEMIILVNLVIKLMVTGLFTALFLVLFTRLGILPMMMFSVKEEDDEKDENTPY